MTDALKQQIIENLKDAMRARDKRRIGTLRLITAAIKQKEVDERIEVNDEQLLIILDKLVKQRRESINQYQKAQRDDLIEQEEYELTVIMHYLPEPLSDSEINDLIQQAINICSAASIRDMGKVMAQLKPQMQGRADMGKVSQLIKQQLA